MVITVLGRKGREELGISLHQVAVEAARVGLVSNSNSLTNGDSTVANYIK